MIANLKTSNLIDKFFSNLIEKTLLRKISSSHQVNQDAEVKFNSQIQESSLTSKNFKNLQNLIKIFSLICVLPYAIIGMFYVNKAIFFIPCLILGTLAVLISMFFSIRIQIVEEAINTKLKNYANNIDKFLQDNADKIEYLRGIEMLEQSPKNYSQSAIFNDLNFIANDTVANKNHALSSTSSAINQYQSSLLDQQPSA